MNVTLFTTLFLVLILIVVFFTLNEKEGFQDPVLHIPESPVKQKNLVEKSQEDYAPSYILAPGPAPGAIASFNSLPYRDPSLEKANYERILNLQTTLQGFLENEAVGLEDLSDPSIQLPLTSARSDLVKLKNEVLVLKRNPGIDSSLTQGDVDEIQANLVYLQKKWRLSIYNDVDIEGFQDASGSEFEDVSGSEFEDVSGANYSYSTMSTPSSDSTYSSTLATSNTSNYSSNTSNYSSNTSNYRSSSNIKTTDLRDLINKIGVTISRLGISGTNDPVILARISVLERIKKKVQTILDEVVSGLRSESEIPITKDAYDNFLKTISDVNSPVSKLFGSNVALADLFPKYANGDVNGAKLAQLLFTKYSDMLFKGISFDLNIRYASQAEQSLANSLVNAIGKNAFATSMFPSSNMLQAYDINTSNNTFSETSGTYSNGYNANIFSDLTTQNLSNTSGYTYSNNASPFDWHERANFICDSVQKRGLNPKDFGCLAPDEYVSENFSWRGYAKMICTRLGTSMDTGLPEVCGCPPANWSGWRP